MQAELMVGVHRPSIILVKVSSKLMVQQSDIVAMGLPPQWCDGAVRCVKLEDYKYRAAAADDAECDIVMMVPANRVLPDLGKYATIYRKCLGKGGCDEVKELVDYPKAMIGVCHTCAGTERETDSRTCIKCGVPKRISCFNAGRKTCTKCRNDQKAKNNIAKADVDSSLLYCRGCCLAKAEDKFTSPEIQSCIVCTDKEARR